jgi:putative tryptophan/tyrosine transport system substrate-binding protein
MYPPPSGKVIAAMQRRTFGAWTVAGFFAPHLQARAQPEARVFRVGVLRPGEPPLQDDLQRNLLPIALNELGYTEGRTLLLQARYANGDMKLLPPLASSFVNEAFDVVVSIGAPATEAMKKATSTLPIVMFGNFDPLELGLVDNLARPGANITGVLIAPDGTLAGKRLQLLKQAVPQATRIGLLIPDDQSISQTEETRKAAQELGVALSTVTVRDRDYAAAFAALVRERAAALVVGSHQYFVRDRRQIIKLAEAHRLPAIYEWREQVADGGLMTYSTDLLGRYRRIASYVDRILKGAKPGDLPIDRPYRFELVINLKTARALGLSIPQPLLLRADELIE